MKKSAVSALIGLTLCILFSCNGEKAGADAEDALVIQAAAVETREIRDEVSGFGSLSYSKKVDIAASQNGVIEKLLFREGDVVKKGEIIAVLSNPQISLAVQRAENTLAQSRAALSLAESQLLQGTFQAEAQILNIKKAEAEIEQTRLNFAEQRRKLDNQKKLFMAGGVSEEGIRDARFSLETAASHIRLMEIQLDIQKIGFREQDIREAGFPVPADEAELHRNSVILATATLQAQTQAARASVLAAEKELSSCNLAEQELILYAPTDGVVGARYLEEGERIEQAGKIITLMDTESLFAVFSAPESDALRLEKSMEALIMLDGAGGGEYTGAVDLVYPIADSQSFTFSVRVRLNDAHVGDIKPGMFARVRVFCGAPRKSPVIPETALAQSDGAFGEVFVVNGGTVNRRKVSLGATVGGSREIVSGLEAGEVVAAHPDQSLREGAYVSVF